MEVDLVYYRANFARAQSLMTVYLNQYKLTILLPQIIIKMLQINLDTNITDLGR